MSKKREWLVLMRCVVRKEVVTDVCTKEEATNDPWDHAEDEREMEQEDWEVIDVRPND